MNKNILKITEKDLEFIYGKDYELFKNKIIPNCYCSKCDSNYCSKIVDYKIFLNDLNDVTLEGSCSDCGSKIARYVETGEVEEYENRIEDIKKRYLLN
jgi:hypothetical protein